jgi:hypothetical protein
VLPIEWQRMYVIPPKLTYAERKEVLTQRAKERFPSYAFSSSKAKSVEEADALLIAWYGFQQLAGKSIRKVPHV